MPKLEDLQADIDRWRAHHWKRGVFLDRIKVFLFVVSVTCGTVASVTGLADMVSHTVFGILAAAPPLLQPIYGRVAARAAWHFQFHAQLGALYRELSYEDGSLADVSHRFSELEASMASKFPTAKVVKG